MFPCAGKKSVDCGKGQSLNNAVQRSSPGDTITFTGVCKESVTVVTSGITLTGDGNAVIQSPSPSQDALIVDGAQRVTLTRFTVQKRRQWNSCPRRRRDYPRKHHRSKQRRHRHFPVGDSSASISSSALNNGVDDVDAEDSSPLIFTGLFTAQGNM